MTQGKRCDNCGSVSNDPVTCDVCGASLADPGASVVDPGAPWLEQGDVLELSLSSGVERQPLAAGDTLLPTDETPDPDQTATDMFSRESTATRAAIEAFDQSSLGKPRQSTLVSAPTLQLSQLFDPVDVGVRQARLTLVEETDDQPARRVWRAVDEDGRLYRVEERGTPSVEAIPEQARALEAYLDTPLGVVRRGEREVRVYRHVPGQTLHERLEARTDPMTPTEICEWIRPLARLLQRIHDAGLVCLRLCPYTVLYTASGDVVLHGVEVLYPLDAPLPRLPAIEGYTAPEVYEASVDNPPGVAADIYGVAMIVYALIANADPPTSVYTAYTPVIGPRDFAPGFPLGFANVLQSLGAHDPARRPQSASAMMALLDAARERSVRQLPTTATVPLSVASDTHVGVVKRQHNPTNQDSVFAGLDGAGTASLLVVADGVSTARYGSGDAASQVASICAQQAWRAFLANPETVRERGVRQWLVDLLQRMNAGVIDTVNEAHAPFETEPIDVMGSTCVAAFVQSGICTLASLGDSRAYLVRRGTVEQITRDHNLITLGVASGLDPDVAMTLPHGEALARCLGAFDYVGEKLRAAVVEPDVYVFPLLPGDRLVLCSDGLTDYLHDDPVETAEAIARIVEAAAIPELACVDLLSAANHGGGGDNIGVAVCFADPEYGNAFDWFAAVQGGVD